VIYLIGESKNDIASSQYLVSQHKVQLSPAPAFNLDEEFAVQQATSKAISNDLIQSAHDISEGGLFISLLESAMPNNLGFEIAKPNATLRNDAFLFGEAQSRIVVSVSTSNVAAFEKLMQDSGVKLEKLGTVTGGNIQIAGADFGKTEQYKNTYLTSLESKLA
jgi:phosphoribosylformylglycinamidine synthase